MTQWNHADGGTPMQPMNGRTIFALHETNQWASLRRELGERYYRLTYQSSGFCGQEVQARTSHRRVDPQ